MDRNNTSFSYEVKALFESLNMDKDNRLRYYQKLPIEYFKSNIRGARGLLIYHMPGLGKSILASAIADAFASSTVGGDIIILSTKATQANMQYTLETKYKQLFPESTIDTNNISYVTMNAANLMKKMREAIQSDDEEKLFNKFIDAKLDAASDIADFNGKLIIVDEAHNLFRRIINGSAPAIKFYETVMKSEDVKLIFLTGTPISSSVYEVIPCFNMLNKRSKFPLFPEIFSDFEKYFMDAEGNLANRDKFINRISGLVSYAKYRHDPASGPNPFPTMRETIVRSVPMASQQYVAYLYARDKEKKETSADKGGPSTSKFSMSKVSTSYRVRSRQICNFMPPNDWIWGADDSLSYISDRSSKMRTVQKIVEDEKEPPTSYYVQSSQFNRIGGGSELEIPVEMERIRRLPESLVTSPKLVALYNDMINSEGCGVVYSQFAGVAGIGIIARYLELHGHEMYRGQDIPSEKGRFAIYTGSESADARLAIRERQVRPDNMDGDYIRWVLMTGAGAEGIDLAYMNNTFQFEAYWNAAREKQFKHRAKRYLSHAAMPPERQYVQPYIYIADHAEDATPAQRAAPTSDQSLFESSMKGKKQIKTFTAAFKEASIECTYNNLPVCHRCLPNNARLFDEDIDKDMKMANPCLSIEKKEVQATELSMDDGRKFYYSPAEMSLYGYAIYYYDPNIGAIVKVAENNPQFTEVLEIIQNKSR